MQTGPSKRTDRRAQAAQAGVAALVTASLLAFSLIAFRTGLVDDLGPGVKAQRPAASESRPIVLPASPRPVADDDAATTVAAGDDALVATTTSEDVVLGTRQTREATATADGPAGFRAPFSSVDLRGLDFGRTLSNVKGVEGKTKDGKPSKAKAKKSSEARKPAKDKQTGHEKARGDGHRKHDPNDTHGVRDTGASVTPSNGEGRSKDASDRAGSKGKSKSSHGKSNKADHGRSRNKKGR